MGAIFTKQTRQGSLRKLGLVENGKKGESGPGREQQGQACRSPTSRKCHVTLMA